jgi:hypothetical protein
MGRISRSLGITRAPKLDLVIAERIRFAIIAKLPGLPARIAAACDPRR